MLRLLQLYAELSERERDKRFPKVEHFQSDWPIGKYAKVFCPRCGWVGKRSLRTTWGACPECGLYGSQMRVNCEDSTHRQNSSW